MSRIADIHSESESATFSVAALQRNVGPAAPPVDGGTRDVP